MIDIKTEEPLDEMRRAYRPLASIWDLVKNQGVIIKDHTGDRYDTGMSLKVIAFETNEEVTQEQIIETIKPGVYYHEKPIQIAEVIVATPKP